MAEARRTWHDTPGVFGPGKQTTAGAYSVLLVPNGATITISLPDGQEAEWTVWSLMVGRGCPALIHAATIERAMQEAEHVLERFDDPEVKSPAASLPG